MKKETKEQVSEANLRDMFIRADDYLTRSVYGLEIEKELKSEGKIIISKEAYDLLALIAQRAARSTDPLMRELGDVYIHRFPV